MKKLDFVTEMLREPREAFAIIVGIKILILSFYTDLLWINQSRILFLLFEVIFDIRIEKLNGRFVTEAILLKIYWAI